MSSYAGYTRGKGLRIGGISLLIGTLMAGCGQKKEPAPQAEKPAAPTVQTSQSSPVSASGTVPNKTDLPFDQAVITDPPPPDQRLPELTMTGKSVGKLFLEVERLWSSVRFTTPDGKCLSYLAILDTQMGPIEITLRPDLAPNHVRNFIALAKAGYYDGLVFERTVHEEAEAEANSDAKMDLIEGGCPVGTGDQGYGSIGYWLPRECSDQVKHEEGTVGACHGEDPDTAGCKFYITLCKAPLLDGEFTVFGKVTKGLDIARKIFTQPVRNDAEFPDGDRPEKPIVIRKVTIQPQAITNVAAGGH